MSNCTNVIKICMSEGLNVLSVGYHGVGKTQMVLDEAKSQGLKMKYYSRSIGCYPDLIVVLTDGYGPRPTVQHLSRWFWLVTENGTISHVEGIGRCCRIDRLSSVSVNRIASYGRNKNEY